MSSNANRRAILQRLGSPESVIDELIRFCACPHHDAPPLDTCSFPLNDEPHLDAWRRYLDAAASVGVWPTLRDRIVQFRFPILEGISEEDSYRRATRRGELPDVGPESLGLVLETPERIELLLSESIAGTVPVIVTGQRPDFISLVRALAHRSEPKEIPDSMGACLISGLNNWDRVHYYRREWERQDPEKNTAETWPNAFREFATQKSLYQDRLILLSRGPYSNVRAADLGMDEGEWLERSHRIRLEHECTHYFTLRALGRLGHNVLEEILADTVAIVCTFSRFDHELLLRFMGLEKYPIYRVGGRLENYRGPITDSAFVILQKLAYSMVQNIDCLFKRIPLLCSDRGALARLIYLMTTMAIEEAASETVIDVVSEQLQES